MGKRKTQNQKSSKKSDNLKQLTPAKKIDKKIDLEKPTPRITRSKHVLKPVKKSVNLKKLSPLKKLDKVIDLVEPTSRITRSKHVLEPIKKGDNLEKPAPRVLSKKLDKAIDLVKPTPRFTRSQEKKSLIDVQLVAPTIEQTKIVKRFDFIKLKTFNENDIVLAKQKYSYPWPSRVLKVEKDKVQVFFFGDKRTGFVSSSELYDFTKSFNALKSLLSSKRKSLAFVTGVREVEAVQAQFSPHCDLQNR